MMKAPEIFDNNQLLRQRMRSVAQFSEVDFLRQIAVDRLADRLDLMRRHFANLLDVGAQGGMVAQSLSSHEKLGQITSLDPCDGFVQQASAFGPSYQMDFERLPDDLPQFDAVTSLLYLHQINDLPGLMQQMASILRPDGLFFACLLGGRTLQELRACLSAAEEEILGGISPHVSPMADIRDIGGLLQRAGLALPVADSELLTITYSSIFTLMAELRNLGEGNALIGRRQHFTRRDVFMRAASLYQERYPAEDGKIQASFELIYLTAWKPDASQPKALRPGSATKQIPDLF